MVSNANECKYFVWATVERILPLKNKINSLLMPDMKLSSSTQNTLYIDKFTNATMGHVIPNSISGSPKNNFQAELRGFVPF